MFLFRSAICPDRFRERAQLLAITLADAVSFSSDCWSLILVYVDYNDCVNWDLVETQSP